jgi:Predicted 3'-5' exonuclease related to the exonuclease domain of PolB
VLACLCESIKVLVTTPTDVVKTYRLWLRYELFRGGLRPDAFEASQRNLADFMTARSNIKNRLYGGPSGDGCLNR